MLDQPIVMLDFETTGLSPAMGDRITEVAALRIVGGEWCATCRWSIAACAFHPSSPA
jgi:DNA polymerase III epsilon subunit-like protein